MDSENKKPVVVLPFPRAAVVRAFSPAVSVFTSGRPAAAYPRAAVVQAFRPAVSPFRPSSAFSRFNIGPADDVRHGPGAGLRERQSPTTAHRASFSPRDFS